MQVNMDKYKNIGNAEMQERVQTLRNDFGIALETIVDSLDKDWQNRIVYPRYAVLLCDLFEEAIKEGKSVEDVCGSDIKAYAKEFQATYDFRELEASNVSQVINKVIMFNIFLALCSYVANSITLADTGSLELFTWISYIVVFILFIVTTIVKLHYFKKYEVSFVLIVGGSIIYVICLLLSVLMKQPLLLLVAPIITSVLELRATNKFFFR